MNLADFDAPIATICDSRPCFLGEGPLWHPELEQLFWFDIIGMRLLSRQPDGVALEWAFDEFHSAAGWLDRRSLMLASENGLWHFDIASGTRSLILQLESDKKHTRSNDGRADPYGGFWIGTMGKEAEPGEGTIYRFFRGELRKLVSGLTIPNAICFAPDGRTAYYSDTPRHVVMRQALGRDGWPDGEPEIFRDFSQMSLNPDGAVVDAAGYLWNAQWGAARVARYAPDGSFDRAVPVPGLNSSCPAFGGPDMTTLFVTTAQEGLKEPDAAQGLLYSAETDIKGQREHRVIL